LYEYNVKQLFMAAINPTDVTALIVDEFIRNATNHLKTVSGFINTLSIYPPVPSAAPGIINWRGYTVPPATYTKAEIRDRIILNEIIAKPDDGSIQLETDPEINKQFNENKGAKEGYKVDENAGGFANEVTDLVVSNIVTPATLPASLVYVDLFNVSSSNPTNPNPVTSTGTFEAGLLTPNPSGLLDGGDYYEFDLDGDGQLTKYPETPVFPPPPPPAAGPGEVYPGGATVPLGKLSVVSGGRGITTGNKSNLGLTREEFLKKLNFADGLTISGVDMSRDWAVIATQYISKKEGYQPKATWDVNAYRLGYGTGKILDNGTLRDVRPDKAYYERTKEKQPANGDRTTEQDALKVLEHEIRTTYRAAVVGTSDTKITEADWNALNDRQRAACVSYVYNCGSFKGYPNIPNAIKSKNYIAAANGILNGPIQGKDAVTEDILVYEGLIRRRAEEAGMFAYGL
jgi:GH24 family phage-related lysozyme (muramidase)